MKFSFRFILIYDWIPCHLDQRDLRRRLRPGPDINTQLQKISKIWRIGIILDIANFGFVQKNKKNWTCGF